MFSSLDCLLLTWIYALLLNKNQEIGEDEVTVQVWFKNRCSRQAQKRLTFPKLKSVSSNAKEGKISAQPQSGSNEKVNWDQNLSLNI